MTASALELFLRCKTAEYNYYHSGFFTEEIMRTDSCTLHFYY